MALEPEYIVSRRQDRGELVQCAVWIWQQSGTACTTRGDEADVKEGGPQSAMLG